ncbi:unnamed protein product [Pleuronectes platessa]|uniref:Uncharacterized protein n=1 Tax=Pleuronectes platessa TaxID=8262 RepID=A0A9N7UNH5_PLEPL|nr:unnamed protein product [Pleuronectes platessa]
MQQSERRKQRSFLQLPSQLLSCCLWICEDFCSAASGSVKASVLLLTSRKDFTAASSRLTGNRLSSATD